MNRLINASHDLGPIGSRACIRWARWAFESDLTVGVNALHFVPDSNPMLAEAMSDALRHRSPDVRLQAALISTNKPLTAHRMSDLLLLTAVADKDVSVRQFAAGAIATNRIRPDAAVDLFLIMLQNANSSDPGEQYFRYKLVEWLGNFGKDAHKAAPVILRFLDMSDYRMRLCVIEALGRIRSQDEAVITHLGALLRDPNPEIRAAASTALARITSEPANGLDGAGRDGGQR